MTRFLILLLAILPPVSGCGTNTVVLPNPEILGASPASENQILAISSNRTNHSPKEVRLVLVDGNIDEIQAFYSDKVAFEHIATAIGSHYREFEMADLHRENFRLWRVQPKKFVIQLSEYEGDRLLILTRIREPRKGVGAD